ncbi:hypothetical protein [Paractinoplanes abujensis]|uniref:Uncharacterized protein n=1 Tax=Paractinoplanes abujensis TaxID=882441 RepID=A0A7W7G6U8_9ACTN|nr:hypothetical protein [Actinoplanes abujensis]MBB4697944.1 hypothetical protein [Actinoplanes abujensis]
MANDDQAASQPRAGMVISVRTRQDVVVIDPDRFLAAARRAYRTDNPDADVREAETVIADVYDAVSALIERYGSLTSDHPDVAGGAHPRPVMHGGFGLLPGDRVINRPDGLSPAGTLQTIELDVPTLQSYGCSLPEDPFAAPDHDDEPRSEPDHRPD